MMRRITRVGVALLLLAVLAVLAVGVLAGTARDAGDATVPAGMRRNQAMYLTMRDGERIAVDLWLPAALGPGARVPTLVQSTRYVRATRPGVLARAMVWFGRYSSLDPRLAGILDAGFAVVLVDARGSGASSGERRIEWSPEERADYGEVVDWIVAQPWSNGRVGGWGVSYTGNTAELLAATGRPAVRAVAPMYDDYDPMVNLVFPGGVFAERFIAAWGAANARLDANDFCGLTGVTGLRCLWQRLFVRGIKPVDADRDGRMLDSIVAARRNYDVLQALRSLAHPRDTLAGAGLTFADVSPVGQRAPVEALGTPMLVRVGWLDAGTMNVALGRFFTLRVPQRLAIGPWNHGGRFHVDPFLPDTTPTEPPVRVQQEEMLSFFRALLASDDPVTPVHEIRYYTMNDGRWRTTTQWPPAGMAPVRWYLGGNGVLTRDAPTADAASDRYLVDTTASTGTRTRWHTQMGGGDVVYPDRGTEDRKLLTYTSAPLARDVEVTGMPLVQLAVTSTHDDGAWFAYLEDVAPDGRVTYVTEGMLRARYRAVSPEAPPYRLWGPHHRFDGRDARPLVPGEVSVLPFELFATSVRFRAGHRIRLALAGADRAVFALVPPGATPEWTVHRSAATPSWIELPMQELP